MGVKVRYRRGAWWVVIHHGGKCRTKKVTDRETGRRLAGALEERLARSDFRLPTADDLGPTLQIYAGKWLDAARGNLKASTVPPGTERRIDVLFEVRAVEISPRCRSSSGIAIRRSRCGCTRTGCPTRQRARASIDWTTRYQPWPRRGQRRSRPTTEPDLRRLF
jgi:hypothetical protein